MALFDLWPCLQCRLLIQLLPVCPATVHMGESIGGILKEEGVMPSVSWQQTDCFCLGFCREQVGAGISLRQ